MSSKPMLSPPSPMPVQPTAQIESDFFNHFFDRNTSFDPFTLQGWQLLKNNFTSHCPNDKSPRLVDIGCGSGASRQIYRTHAQTYTGIDLSSAAIDRAKEKFPEDQWLVGDATNLPLPDHSVDAVAFSSVLHHIPNFQTAVREATRVLTPGGVIFAFDPNLFHPVIGPLRHPRSPLYLSKGVSPNERPLKPAALRSAFLAEGLTDIFQRCHSGIHFRHTEIGLFNHFLSLYNFLDSILEYSGMSRWFGAFIITVGFKPKSLNPLRRTLP